MTRIFPDELQTMKVIGLTGGSGAGKSTVARFLCARGMGWVDADAVYHRLCRENREMLAELADAFGDVLNEAGALDRARLAPVVFASPERLALLGTITYPYIRAASREAFAACAREGRRSVLYDAPTLFQSGADELCGGGTIGVVAPRGTRIARIMARDGITRAQAEARIDAQPDDGFYRSRCRWIIENDASQEETERRCAHLFAEIQKA